MERGEQDAEEEKGEEAKDESEEALLPPPPPCLLTHPREPGWVPLHLVRCEIRTALCDAHKAGNWCVSACGRACVCLHM